MEVKKYQPRILVKNRVYLNYQLFAVVDNKRTSAQSAMVIAVLTSLSWLRKKFVDFQLPPELAAPEPDNYQDVSLESFKQLHINYGYTVDIVSLPKEGVWSLRLKEPDFGYESADTGEITPAVPGRMIETNIAFRIVDDTVECGFQTIIAEPENCEVPCAVFRPTVVKELARNPLVGLRQEYKIQDSPHRLSKRQEINRLFAVYSEGHCSLPFIVFSEHIQSKTVHSEQKSEEEILREIFKSNRFLLNTLYKPDFIVSCSDDSQRSDPCLPYDIDNLSRFRMAFSLFFVLQYDMIDIFKETFNTDIDGGDVVFIEQKKYSDIIQIHRLPENQKDRREKLIELSESTRVYPKNKDVDYRNVLFYSQAMALYYQTVAKGDIYFQEILDNCENCKLSMEKEKRLAIERLTERLNSSANDFENQQAKFDSEIRRKDEQILVLKREKEENENKLKNQIEALEKDVEFYSSYPQRPKVTSQVPDWVSKRFKDRLTFHKRAENLICDTKNSEVDMKLLCDALEFLATDYRDKMTGKMSEETMNAQCSKRYGRRFDVTPLGSQTIEYTPKDYKIKYNTGKLGKPVETPLDLHLRVGTDNENLIRIYFLYDKKNQLIVVGSLPKHLPNITGF